MSIRVERQGSGEEATFELIEQGDVQGWTAETPLAVVGRRHPRLEGREKVTGTARYTYDVRLPRQLYAKVLRSPHPHARITGIDTSAAERLPGVHAVVSSVNAGDIDWYEKSKLFDTTLRFIGDEVAAVAAESEEIAEDALRLIHVEYEVLSHVTDLDRAMEPDAPKVWADGNVAQEPKVYDRGDAEAGLREADVVVDETYRTAVALHNALEPHGCTAAWEGDHLTLYDSTQSIFTIRQQVAESLGVPEHRLRVIKEHMGGGFGAKQIAWKQDVIAALLSREAGRPVQLMLDREAENLAVGNRPSTRQRVRLGARRDGTLTAIWADIAQARGAYLTGGEASNVSGMYQTLYRCENVHTHEVSIYINAGPAVAFRAPGHVESAFALEQAMDELARKLDMDPVELRRRNYSEVDQLEEKPYSLPEGLRLCYDRVTEAIGWESYRKPASTGSKRRGVGFAAHDWVGGAGHPPGNAFVEMNSDGTVDVVTGTQDIGTGTRTGLAQIAAEELGVPLERIAFHLGDTGTGPYAPVSSGSATQATVGPAIRVAASQVKEQLLQVAAAVLEASVDDLSIREGKIFVADNPSEGTPIEEVMQKISPHTLQARGGRTPNPSDVSVRTFGAQFIEVEVDIETGELTVLRVVTAHDIGRIVNPTMVDSQVIGGITQGLGFGTVEERVIDERLGVVLNANLEDYKIPTIADVPPIEHIPVDVPDTAANSTGAKGVGEPPLVPTGPALANAVYDATGIRIRTGPLTRQRILDHLASLSQSEGNA
ncbi:MAG TPA: xanthine dehydrogenase family protein molybdopterin-binding subunit [Thermomicrobiales bacterium]|nr:xanthine dehydrogenase family protein molybdopterin-binding subunit [Thermomicrobiales bacterium]